jgi:hypothetical protein
VWLAIVGTCYKISAADHANEGYHYAVLGVATDNFMDYCLDHPPDNALEGFEKFTQQGRNCQESSPGEQRVSYQRI